MALMPPIPRRIKVSIMASSDIQPVAMMNWLIRPHQADKAVGLEESHQGVCDTTFASTHVASFPLDLHSLRVPMYHGGH